MSKLKLRIHSMLIDPTIFDIAVFPSRICLLFS